MYYVYRAINRTKGEVYHGVSDNPKKRKDGSHCVGGTKSLRHWNCWGDNIRWSIVSKHYKQTNASKKAHDLERKYKHRNRYKNIKTAGI